MSALQCVGLVLAAALAYVVLEQLSFALTCRNLPSPPGLFVPLVGGIVDMVKDPYGFWEKQRKLAPAGISKFFLLGKNVFFSCDTDVSRRILMHNGPDALMMVRTPAGGGPEPFADCRVLPAPSARRRAARVFGGGDPSARACSARAARRRERAPSRQRAGAPCARSLVDGRRVQAVHPSGKWILGPKNLAFMYGPDHKALRKSFLSLFTTKALGVYVSVQVRFARGGTAPDPAPARRCQTCRCCRAMQPCAHAPSAMGSPAGAHAGPSGRSPKRPSLGVHAGRSRRLCRGRRMRL